MVLASTLERIERRLADEVVLPPIGYDWITKRRTRHAYAWECAARGLPIAKTFPPAVRRRLREEPCPTPRIPR